jgi:hypothetical protein
VSTQTSGPGLMRPIWHLARFVGFVGFAALLLVIAPPGPYAAGQASQIPTGSFAANAKSSMTVRREAEGVRSAVLKGVGSRPIRYHEGVVPDETPTYDELGSTVATSGTLAAVGAIGVNGTGAVYIYVHTRARWNLQAVLKDPSNVPGDEFGSAVELSGSTLLVDAAGVNNNAGRVYAYVRSASRWVLQKIIDNPCPTVCSEFGSGLALEGSTAIITVDINTGGGVAYIYSHSGTKWALQAEFRHASQASVNFGQSVTVSGSTALIMGDSETGVGQAYIYVRTGTRWRLQAVLTDPATGNIYGASAAIVGNTALIGSPAGADPGGGSVYFYSRSNQHWTMQDTFADPDVSTFGQAVAMTDTNIIIGAYNGGYGRGVAYAYSRAGAQWQLNSTISDPGKHVDDEFGGALGVSGTTLLIGAEGTTNADGAAYFYSKAHATWRRTGKVTDTYNSSGEFRGGSVAISGTNIVIGASGAHGNVGVAFIYSRSRTRWRQVAQLNYPGPAKDEPDAQFGTSVAISGTTAVVGATEPYESEGGGAVYIYVRSRGKWSRQATLSAPTGSGSYFGWSTAISGNLLVVGAPGVNSNFGAVYVYARSKGRWRPVTGFISEAETYHEGYGDTVAVSNGTVIVGTSGFNQGSGVAYIYAHDGTRWIKQATLADPGRTPSDSFGQSVAVAGATAVIGANGTDNYDGAAYVYTRIGGAWHLQKILRSQKGVHGSGFAYSVAISTTGGISRVLVGGLAISGVATGPHQCGRAFEFMRHGRRWHEAARLVDAQCRSYDQYGYSAAISRRIAVIGAPGADHNSGRVYVVTLP